MKKKKSLEYREKRQNERKKKRAELRQINEGRKGKPKKQIYVNLINNLYSCDKFENNEK